MSSMIDPSIIDQRIKRVMSEVLGVSVSEIHDGISVRSLASWKGLNHLRLLEALEKEFRLRFEPEEGETLVNYKIIRATILAYLQS